jgi:transcriptional regulator with XRE-family HTH domain
MSIAVITDWEPVFDDRATGAKARALRKSKGIKARTVSKMMGMCTSHFSEIESGRRGWNMEKVQRYERALEYITGEGIE